MKNLIKEKKIKHKMWTYFLLESHFYCSLLPFLVCAYRRIGPCCSVNSDKWQGFQTNISNAKYYFIPGFGGKHIEEAFYLHQ